MHLGKPPHQWGDHLGQKGSFGVLEESTATSLWQEGQTETYPNGPCHSPACPSLRHVSIRVNGGWVLKRGVWGADPGRGLRLAVRRQPVGTGVRSSATFLEEARTMIEEKHHR